MAKKQKKGNEINSLIYVFSLILIFEIILIIKILKRFFYSKPFLNKNNNNKNEITYKNCKCSNCKKRYKKYLLNIKKNNINLYFYIYIILFIFFLLLLITFYQKIQILNEKKNFNPFKILQIPRKSNITTIKKAFYKLSKKYHPDKPLTGNKDKFMKINKAYRALTDKVGKENYEKYGNPDGPGFIKIEIALPEFLFKGKTANFILIIFTFFMIGVLPVWFMLWFHKKDKYNESGMMNVDQSIFYQFLDKNCKIEEIIFIVGLANEFEDIKIDNNDEINKIEKKFKKYEKYFLKNFDLNLLSDGNKKAIVFLYEYFLHEYEKNLFEDFDEKFINFMLKITNLILDNMIYMCINISMSYDFYKTFDFFPENMFKNYDLNIIKNLIILKQNLFQTGNLNLINNYNFLLQLANISKENFYLFKNIKNFQDLKNSIDNFKKDFNNDFFEDIKNSIENIPEYKIESNISLISYEIGDLIILKHKIKRLNLLENEKIGFNHSNIFPENFDEKLILIIINEENKIIFWKILNFSENNKNYFEIENNLLAEKKGKNIFKILLYSLNFIDIFYENLLEINIENKNDFKLNFKKNRMRFLMSSEEINEYYNNNKSPYYYLLNNNKKLKED